MDPYIAKLKQAKLDIDRYNTLYGDICARSSDNKLEAAEDDEFEDSDATNTMPGAFVDPSNDSAPEKMSADTKKPAGDMSPIALFNNYYQHVQEILESLERKFEMDIKEIRNGSCFTRFSCEVH